MCKMAGGNLHPLTILGGFELSECHAPQGLNAHVAAHLGPGAPGTPSEDGSLGGLAARLASKMAKAEARLASLAPAPDSAFNFRPAVGACHALHAMQQDNEACAA